MSSTGPKLATNVAANLAGRFTSTAAMFVFVPLYLRLLGPEQFALIGVFTVLQAFVSLADLGLSAALSRELARLSAIPERAPEMRSLVKAMERVFIVLAVSVAVAMAASGPTLALRWLSLDELSPDGAVLALRVMGVALSLAFVATLYHWGLMGIQRQLSANAVLASGSFVRGAGAVLLLAEGAIGVTGFFAFHAACYAVQCGVGRLLLMRALPPVGALPTSTMAALAPLRDFSLGMVALSTTTVLLTQIDKIVLTRLLPLSTFGLYTLASTLATAPQVVGQAVFGAVYPRLTQHVARGSDADLTVAYHRYSQLVAVPVASVGALLTVLSPHVLTAWTGRPAVAEQMALPLAWLGTGAMLSGLTLVPFALLLAHGAPGLSVRFNAFACVAAGTALLLLAPRMGAVAGGVVWAAINALYVVAFVPLVHQRYLRGATRSWVRHALLAPVAAAFAVTLVARWSGLAPTDPVGLFGWLVVVLGAAAFAAACATPTTRALLAQGRNRLAS